MFEKILQTRFPSHFQTLRIGSIMTAPFSDPLSEFLGRKQAPPPSPANENSPSHHLQTTNTSQRLPLLEGIGLENRILGSRLMVVCCQRGLGCGFRAEGLHYIVSCNVPRWRQRQRCETLGHGWMEAQRDVEMMTQTRADVDLWWSSGPSRPHGRFGCQSSSLSSLEACCRALPRFCPLRFIRCRYSST